MDHTDFEKSKQGSEPKTGDPGYWWKCTTPEDRSAALIAAASVMKNSQGRADRSQANLTHARLYGNIEQLGFGIREYSRTASAPQNKISLNVCASCPDTLAAKIAKNKPRPMFLTDGGDFAMQRKAKRLDKFMRGLFYETKLYQKSVQIFLDGCVFDIAAMKFSINPVSKKMNAERVFPDELFVDEADAIYGAPRQLMQRKLIPKEVLLAEYGHKPEICKQIEDAANHPDAYAHGFGDSIEVWESWHLRSSKKSSDGCHCIAINGCELFHEEWKHDFFPFAFFRFSNRVLGFWGQSLVERLSGIQLEINRLLRSVSEQLRRKGRGRIFVKIGSKVNPEHMRNSIGDVVFYAGEHPPTVDNGNAVAPEEFMQLDRLYQKAYQEAGISELSAGAKKPSGLDAAVAIREFNDVESERFSLVGRAWEQFFLDCAEIQIGLIQATGGDYPVTLPGKRNIEKVNWKEIDLERDAYIMQMFPVSSLPQTPSYRRQTVTELVQEGYIPDKATAMRLLDFPDIESESNLALAALDDADESISAILDNDKPTYKAPDEFSDPNAIITRASAAYLRAKHQGVEDARMGMLVQLIDAAKAILAPPPDVDPASAQGSPMAPMAPPAGMPMPGMPPMGPATGDITMNQMGAPQPASVPPLIPQ